MRFEIFHGDTLLNEWDGEMTNDECGMTNALNLAFMLHGFHFLKDEGVMAIIGRISNAEFRMSN